MEPSTVADPTTAIKPYLDLLVSYGWPSIISMMVTWLLWKLIPFVPKWVETSIEAQQKVPVELSRMNDNMENILAVSSTGSEQLRVGLHHIANAARRKLKDENDAAALEIEKAVEHLGRNPNHQ